VQDALGTAKLEGKEGGEEGKGKRKKGGEKTAELRVFGNLRLLKDSTAPKRGRGKKEGEGREKKEGGARKRGRKKRKKGNASVNHNPVNTTPD